jgi:hypothetical protein
VSQRLLSYNLLDTREEHANEIVESRHRGSVSTHKDAKGASPAGKGRSTSKGTFDTKIILILNEQDGDDVKRIDKDVRVIAVVMPNDTKVLKQKWSKYQVSVEEVEKLTSYTFFDKVPDKVAKALRKKGDE